MEENITDRVSELPGFIIHHILSYLDSPKELVRMSVLSKYWFQLTASFPILDFSFRKVKKVIESSGIPIDTEKDKRDMFYRYVEYTVSRFCEQHVSMHTFKLVTVFPDPSDVEIIDRCLGLILEKGVKVLVIDVLQHHQMYRLPNILLSASSLTSMKLYECELPSSLLVDVVRFKSLKVLHLDAVPLNEEMFKRLTTGCPFLEELAVNRCHGLKRFCVHGHLILQQVEVSFGREFESIDIEVPNLYDLSLYDCDRGRGSPPSMNLTSCKKLTKLCYHGKGLTDFSSNFPFLEDLFLDLPNDSKRLNLSSHSLRTFMLHSECKLDKIDIDAPNLLFFGCTGYMHCCFSWSSIPSKPCMEIARDVFVDNFWFELRQFLDKNNGFKELKFHISVGCREFKELKVIQWPPFKLDHIELEVETFQELWFYEAVVDSLLWCCRPQSLTLTLDFPLITFAEWDSVIQHTYEKLLQQEDQVHTNIQFVLSSSSSKEKMNFSDLSTLFTALASNGQQTVTFIKTEVVQKAGL